MNKQKLFRVFLIVVVAAVAAMKFQEFGGDLTVTNYFNMAESMYRTHIADPRTIREYFRTQTVRKLQLGAGGNNATGWLNTDIEPHGSEIYLDATSRYPFADGSFQYIFAEHLIEHLPWEGGLAMLKECHRVLAPGGKIRIVTPNLAKLFYLLNASSDIEAQKFIEAERRLFGWADTPVMPVYVINKNVREWGHQFIYDPTSLRRTLEIAGFSEIKEHHTDDKTDPIFGEVEFRTRALGYDVWFTNRWGSMAFEAVR